MARRGGSLGIAALVVVMAVVLVLVARSWERTAPAAVDLERLPAASEGELPGLREMNEATDAHVDRLEQLSEID